MTYEMILQLTDTLVWDTTKPFNDQNTETKEYAANISNYKRLNTNLYETEKYSYRQRKIKFENYELVYERRWIKKTNKPTSPNIYIQKRFDRWDFESRPMRLIIPDENFSKLMVENNDFRALFAYFISPPENVEFPMKRSVNAWEIYLNTIQDEHEILLQSLGLNIEYKPIIETWHEESRPMRFFISHETVSSGLKTSDLTPIITFALDPSNGIISIPVNEGWMLYLNTLEPTHRTVLEKYNIQIVMKNETK